MKQNSPVKRDKALIPLSHDHHHGLVVARRVGEGLKRQVDPERIVAYVQKFWTHDLQRHFQEEEDLAFSLLPADDELGLRAMDEHRRLRACLQSLERPGTDRRAALAEFALLLEAHIRFEERILFPHIERSATVAQLEKAGEALQQAHTLSTVVWADEFWKV